MGDARFSFTSQDTTDNEAPEEPKGVMGTTIPWAPVSAEKASGYLQLLHNSGQQAKAFKGRSLKLATPHRPPGPPIRKTLELAINRAC